MRGGGQWLLRGVPHVLRVRLIAPFEHRVKQWIKRTTEMTGETPNQRAAADLVRRDDVEKSGRMRYLYEVDIADPTLYELVVNTEKLKYEAVVGVAEGLVRRPEMATTEVGRQMVVSRALASRVQVALATHPQTRRYRITVEARSQRTEPGDIPARPGEARDEARSNGVIVLCAMTMGISRVASRAGPIAAVLAATMTSTFRRTISSAKARKRARSPSANRYSMTMFFPSTYPSSRRPL